MVKQINLSDCGILFDPEAASANSRIIQPAVLAIPTDDKEDILADTHDKLKIEIRQWRVKIQLGWWIVEYLPMILPRKKFKPDGTPHSKRRYARIHSTPPTD